MFPVDVVRSGGSGCELVVGVSTGGEDSVEHVLKIRMIRVIMDRVRVTAGYTDGYF